MSRLNYNDQNYMSRLEQRRRKRRRNNIVALMVFLNVVIVLAIFFVLGKFIISGAPTDKADANQTINQNVTVDKTLEAKEDIKQEDKKENKKENKATGDYSSYYCYEADKQERYESYHNLNPGLPVDEVVWRVNANLDKPFYGFDVPVSDINDPYVIVNKYYKVTSAQEPQLTTVDGYLMTPATAEAYKKMRSDAASNGLSIAAASTYRSVSYQEGLYNSYLNRDPQNVVDTYSARAGYSEHHTGMAIDFIGSFGSLNDFANTKEYPWVRDNCHKYGFIIRYTAQNQWITGYKDEPWHLRYVGAEVATDMKNKGVSSFEEYKVKYIDHQPQLN